MFNKTRLLAVVCCLGLNVAPVFSQAKSAIQFYDTNGTNQAGKIGWSGDAANGYFFIQTPQNGEVIKTKATGVDIAGTVTATKFEGNGSALTGLPVQAVTVGSVGGLVDSLGKKASVADVNTKVDSAWVVGKMPAAGVGDNSVTSGKIVDSTITGADINKNANLNVATVVTSGNSSLGSISGVNGSFFLSTIGSSYFMKSVGIGTTNPTPHFTEAGKALVISGGSGRAAIELWDERAPGQKGYFQQVGGITYLGNIGGNTGSWKKSNDLVLTAGDGKEALRILGENGNVGIGTSTPSCRLDLGSGYGSSGEKFLIYNDNPSSPLAGTKMGFYLDQFSKPNNTTMVYATHPVNPGTFVFASKNTDNTTLGPQMVIFGETGNVSIGSSLIDPNTKLEVAGTIKCDALTQTSDLRFKTQILPLTSSLAKVSQLQGVSYSWDRAKWPAKNFSESRQIGLIAQDVEKVFPEVVNTDKDGYKSLAYDKLTAVLIEAVKELKKENAEQRKEILELRTAVEGIKK